MALKNQLDHCFWEFEEAKTMLRLYMNDMRHLCAAFAVPIPTVPTPTVRADSDGGAFCGAAGGK